MKLKNVIIHENGLAQLAGYKNDNSKDKLVQELKIKISGHEQNIQNMLEYAAVFPEEEIVEKIKREIGDSMVELFCKLCPQLTRSL